MKYIVLLGDGMADNPIPALKNRTPLEAALKPNMDFLAQHGEMGFVRTVPDGFPPGSDVANLSVFGYEPKVYYTGRSPLEAASMGIPMSKTDVAIRCNLVTLSQEKSFKDKTMVDYSSGEITTEEARELMQVIADTLNTPSFSFYPGISYRHCLIWKEGNDGVSFTPPHDISGRKIASSLPKGEGGDVFISMMKKSERVLTHHPINQKRVKEGLNPATSIWLWGQGRKPQLKSFREKYHLSGSVISAVDLVHGLGILAGLMPVHVEGATGNAHTNYRGKANAALNELENGSDFVYIHVEAPDECGHQGLVEEKVRSIERIDQELLGPLLSGLSKWDYSILLLPDHPTPIATKTHSSEPVPFAIYQKNRKPQKASVRFTEKDAASTGLLVDKGYTLMDRFLLKNT